MGLAMELLQMTMHTYTVYMHVLSQLACLYSSDCCYGVPAVVGPTYVPMTDNISIVYSAQRRLAPLASPQHCLARQQDMLYS